MTYNVLNEKKDKILARIEKIKEISGEVNIADIESTINEQLIEAFNLGVEMSANDYIDMANYDLEPEERKNSILELKL